jgi:hypothetical protein
LVKEGRMIGAACFVFALLAAGAGASPQGSPLALASPRVNATATLLPGGYVLVAGGFADQGRLSSARGDAEILDPRHADGRGRIAPPLPLAGKLLGARALHVAVPLADGRVLLVGGDLGGTIEVFDAHDGARGEFRLLGRLRHGPRVGHTATLLDDGRILIAGGLRADRKLHPRTELFDPATGVTSDGPVLGEPRHSHTATPLSDGRVLLAGGVGRSSTEIFRASDDTLAAGPALGEVRDDHRATRLLDGRVLLIGGQDAKGRALDSAEILDPVSRTVTTVGRLRRARADHAQVLLEDGRVLILGGEHDDGSGRDEPLASVEVFDPVRRAFHPLHDLGSARDDAAAVLLGDGRIAVIGGQASGDAPLASIEFYRP